MASYSVSLGREGHKNGQAAFLTWAGRSGRSGKGGDGASGR